MTYDPSNFFQDPPRARQPDTFSVLPLVKNQNILLVENKFLLKILYVEYGLIMKEGVKERANDINRKRNVCYYHLLQRIYAEII